MNKVVVGVEELHSGKWLVSLHDGRALVLKEITDGKVIVEASVGAQLVDFAIAVEEVFQVGSNFYEILQDMFSQEIKLVEARRNWFKYTMEVDAEHKAVYIAENYRLGMLNRKQ